MGEIERKAVNGVGMGDSERKSESREFLEDFRALSSFGATDGGGVDRQAATKADASQREWLRDWFLSHGFTTHYDEIGNQFGLLELTPGAPFVITGSHLDSQPLAGRYDGAYGVLASAHAVRRLAREWAMDGVVPRYNVAVVNWFNEEGSRFQPSMLGSSVYTGKLPVEDAYRIEDRAGVAVREALAELGQIGTARMLDAVSYAEIHVEQGRVLENNGITIGLVDATWGARKYRFRVLGEQSHSGSTPMAERRDALFGAALLIAAARKLTSAFEEGALHTAVSSLEVLPNSPVVVAREAEFLLDLRSEHTDILDRAERMLADEVRKAELEARVSVEQHLEHSWDLDSYQEAGVKLARRAADEVGLTSMIVKTVAGHDSTNMKDVVPTVMLFVPSVAGISHNEAEFTLDDDACDGVDLLTSVLRKLVDGQLVETTT